MNAVLAGEDVCGPLLNGCHEPGVLPSTRFAVLHCFPPRASGRWLLLSLQAARWLRLCGGRLIFISQPRKQRPY